MVIEFNGKRFSVVGESKTDYIVTKPFQEERGETIIIPKKEVKIIYSGNID